MDEPPRTNTPRRTRRIRILRGLGWCAAALVAAWTAFSIWIEQTCLFEPPQLEQDHPAMELHATQETATLRRCGPAWLVTGDGIAELYIEGDAVSRGRQMAELCGSLLMEGEAEMRVQLDRALPAGLGRYFIRKGVLFAFRDLQSYVERDDELAIAATLPTYEALGAGPMDGIVPTYHRILFYQALYDAGQAMAESGLLDAELGCTSFAASGAATKDGGLVVARNCDFEGGRVFDERKVVFFVGRDETRKESQRYVAVSWAGMVGVLSGVNESGLVVMLHAARTEDSKWPHVGRPVPLILAAALRGDHTIEEVAQRFRDSPPHAAAMVVVAETATGRSAVIETDPTRTLVVRDADGVTICANHLRDAAWDGDEVAQRIRRSGSSAQRFARMQELVSSQAGRIDAQAAAAILRDRRGGGGIDIGLGNRTAVSAMLVAHAVVWDGAARRLYVSRAPRGLGEFVAYDAGAFFDGAGAPPPGGVRAHGGDRIGPLADPEAAASVEHARDLLRGSRTELADADEAVRLLDRAPAALLARAEALLRLGRAEEARDAAILALARQPVPGSEEDRLRAIAGAGALRVR